MECGVQNEALPGRVTYCFTSRFRGCALLSDITGGNVCKNVFTSSEASNTSETKSEPYALPVCKELFLRYVMGLCFDERTYLFNW